jgi:uncharacterized protein YciI
MPIVAREIAYQDGNPHLAVRDAHRAHMAELHAAGTLLMSGPWTANDGALILYDVEDVNAARALIAEDPYTAEGVVTEVSLREWNVVFGR